MIAHLRYLRYVLRHKWYVFRAGLIVHAPLLALIVHDLSKFLPSEWAPYVRNFYGESEDHFIGRHVHGDLSAGAFNAATALALAREEWSIEQQRRAAAFDVAWLHHQKRNRHHWQYWLLVNDTPERYPRFYITSMDGGYSHHAITEYTELYVPPHSPYPISADVLGIEGGTDESNARYRMVKRMCDAANARRPVALPMPERYAREMVADWAGAGRAITGRWDLAAWYRKNAENIVLHPDTRRLVDSLVRRTDERLRTLFPAQYGAKEC